MEAILKAVKRLLQALTITSSPAPASDFGSQPLDDRDDFAPIRAANTPTLETATQPGERSHLQDVVTACVDAISLTSQMRLQTGESARDDLLVTIISDCDDDAVFQDLLAPFLAHVQNGDIQVTAGNLDCLLDRLEQPLMSYNHGTSDAFHALATKLLHATIHTWLRESFPKDVREKVLAVYEWLAGHLCEDRLCWWETRDAFRRLCGAYLSLDPKRRFMDEMKVDHQPDRLLLQLVADCDIRVRFGAAVAYGHIFGSDYLEDKDPMVVYSEVRDRLCKVLSE